MSWGLVVLYNNGTKCPVRDLPNVTGIQFTGQNHEMKGSLLVAGQLRS
jgi:hypothetical protein